MSIQTEQIDTALETAQAQFDGEMLTIQTGSIERVWRWTGKGFLTQRTRDQVTGTIYERPDSAPAHKADWSLPGYSRLPDASLKDVRATIADDQGFTSRHIEVTAALAYLSANIELKFVVWAYPDAPGLRTQLHIRALSEEGIFESGEAPARKHLQSMNDYIPLVFGSSRRRWFGYNTDTQRRNDTFMHMLKEEVETRPLKHKEFSEWASVQCVETDAGGIALVKESHKCANQYGYMAGIFKCDIDTGIESTGWGLGADEIDTTWRSAWASWCLVYSGGDLGRERAFKRFDRTRYPLRPERDFVTQANTWGSSLEWLEHREAASEENVLRELESCADLGIEVLQIDDGWQGNDYESWSPSAERYPHGWGTVVAKGKEHGVRLGLWAAAQSIALSDLQQTFKEAGFCSYKLDFAVLNSHDKVRGLMHKVRDLIKGTDHAVRVNWDVTEGAPRFGYFFAREYGCLYLSNRKPVVPSSTTYRPHTMLRDLWEISRYLNLPKFQGTIQNIDRVNRELSDAHLYNHAYCVAITLMSMPLFFQQTLYYDDTARNEIRPLLATYKQHRDALLAGEIGPVGNTPDGGAWTGFQSHDEATNTGYLTIFRELNNDEEEYAMPLNHLSGKNLHIEDLMNGESREVTVGSDGCVTFNLKKPASFSFCRYVVVA